MTPNRDPTPPPVYHWKRWHDLAFFNILLNLFWRESFGSPWRALKTVASVVLGTAILTTVFVVSPGMLLLLIAWAALWWAAQCPGTMASFVRDKDYEMAWVGVRHILISVAIAGGALVAVWWYSGMPTSLSRAAIDCAIFRPPWYRCLREKDLGEKYEDQRRWGEATNIALNEAPSDVQLGATSHLGATAFAAKAADNPEAESHARLEALAKQGDIESIYQLGKSYDYGLGVEKNSWKAREWYQKAAKNGHVEAQHALGLLEHFEHHHAESTMWFREAASQGHVSAQHLLGVNYEMGYGVPRDYETAAEWYERAATAGDAMAMCSLAQLYARGLGVEKNLVIAYAWSSVAATEGWGLGIRYRDQLEKKLSAAQLRDAQTLSAQLYSKYGKERTD